MYKTNKFGVVSCKEENFILAKLERDLSKNKKKVRKQNESTRRNKDTSANNR